MREDGMNDLEQAVMDSLCEAVEGYSLLEIQHPDEPVEFMSAIHRLQDMLATRVCRRLYPDEWLTYGS
jgi:hypothetical protein